MNEKRTRMALILLLSISLLSGCVVVDEYGEVDPVATSRANTAIGVGVFAGTAFYLLGSHHGHRHHHRHHPPKRRRDRCRW